ncbi:ABC transporter substrate-binding protein [Dactylosporangium matsuzakiense]|uniref:ABC transporter substrate-binding protein n=2 Tax=Dactylosporangium matsuzakiense TaxID=53360 RepID=A0A9W6KEJ9_9ACTN|nr:ABC transporter substrate-binding protein [Dactylosporangium matsuzakiense]
MLTVAAVLPAMSGCGGGDEPAAGGKVTVTVGTANQGAVLKAVTDIVDAFNASQSEITVKLQQYPDPQTLLQKTLVQLSAGQPPTVSPCQPAWASAYAKVNGLVDISTMLGAPGALTADDLNDFHPVLLKSTKIGGKQLTLPFDRNSAFLYYNKALLKQGGFTEPPATWAQFAEYAAKLNTADTWAADVFNSPFTVSIWDSMVQAYGGKVLNDDQTAAAFNSQAGRDALRFWVDLVQKKQAKVSSEPNAGQLNFGAGKTALYVADSSALTFIQQAVGGKFEIGAAPMPAGPAGSFSELGGANICLFSRAPKAEQQAGFKFITYLLSKTKNGEFVKASNFLPNRRSTVSDLKDFYAQNPIPAIAVSQLDHAVDPPTVAAWPQIAAAILIDLLAAVRGETSVEDALKKAEKETNDILKK